MGYASHNVNSKRNIRLTTPIKKKRERMLKNKDRWEFNKTMYGNVYQIVDHERMLYYRQDREVDPSGDLFDGYLPFYCDYCNLIVDRIERINYTLVSESLVRAKSNPEWRKSKVDVKFACCDECKKRTLPIPAGLLTTYYLIELYKDGEMIYTQNRKEN